MIVIPMAGLSSRFFKAGYEKPKYMLDAHGMSVFEHVMNGFSSYFSSESFLFIVRKDFNTADFVTSKANKLGIKKFDIIILDSDTRGQAETVYLGVSALSNSANESLTIFNIDTIRRDFSHPDLSKVGDGYLEVFYGDGSNWSFVLPKNNHSIEVIETSEKRPISNLCCTGLYYFASINDFLEAYKNYENNASWEAGELYVAPLYNYLIENKKIITYHIIDNNDVIFCGVPSEYEQFLLNP